MSFVELQHKKFKNNNDIKFNGSNKLFLYTYYHIKYEEKNSNTFCRISYGALTLAVNNLIKEKALIFKNK